MKKVKISLFIFILVALISSLGVAFGERIFRASLLGRYVVPHVNTRAKGEAIFEIGKGGNALTYKLTLNRIKNITLAHVHEGIHGENGPPVVVLFAGPKKEGEFSGTLSEGTIATSEFVGSLKGKPLSSLIKLIEDKKAYVNVHTEQYPDGEIRGQIR